MTLILCATLIVLAIVWKWGGGTTGLTCPTVGELYYEGQQIMLKCHQPPFFIVCDSRTLQRYGDRWRCSSIDGEKYRIDGKFQQVADR